jgi:2',5'-phosphodiesterase
VLLRDAFKQPLPALHAQFAPMLEASPHLAEALQKVTTVAQITLLVPATAAEPGSGSTAAAEGPLAVVNTHLFFHPYAPHIRTMHTAAILEELQGLLRQVSEPGSETAALLAAMPPPAVMFCGDLNSDLNDGVPGVIELLQKGRLGADYWDWVDGAGFKWGQGEEDGGEAQQQAKEANSGTAAAAAAAEQPPADGHDFESAEATPHSKVEVTGVDISSPYQLRSADDLKTPYSNYTSGYVALLDYVWYSEQRLQVLGCPVPVPAREQLQQTFIPSQAFPSDHLAVVYDLQFRQ